MTMKCVRAIFGMGLLAAVMPTTFALAQATLGGDWRADMERYAERLVEAGLTPGMGIAVTQGDWVLYSGGFGHADLSSGRGVGAETVFYIASSTKALTATAVVLLAERGVLELDAPVTRYLPDLRLKPPLDAGEITIWSLLTLTHGIEDGGPVVHRTAYTGDFTDAQLIALLADYGPAETGTNFNYGNLGYNILGLVLDAVAEGTWKDVVQREVLDPLGMTSASAHLSRLDPALVAMPHELVPGAGFQRIRLGKTDETLHAAGGHFATAADLGRFVAAHASGGLLDGKRIFPHDAVVSMHQPHVPQDRAFGPFHRFGWGFGWDIGTFEEKTVVHRFGSFAGYRSHMSFLPEHGIGVVVLVNGDGPASPGADLMATYIYDRLLETPGAEETYAARFAGLDSLNTARNAQGVQLLAERAARLAPLPHPLDAYAGRYENPHVGRMEWRVVAGGLEVRMGAAWCRAEVYAAAENKLRITLTGGGEVVAFTFPPAGGPAASLEYDGRSLVRIDP